MIGKYGWSCGFRKEFKIGYDHFYYDGDWYGLDLGWFWVVWRP